MKSLLAATAAALCLGCATEEPQAAVAPAPEADISVLICGNSHTGGPLPRFLTRFLEQANPGKTVQVNRRSGAFLADIIKQPDIMKELGKGHHAVILQAQKYSTTGRYTYPTDSAESMVSAARKAGSLPLMYPEFPRREVPEEAQRIYDLHVGIARKKQAHVAPVGQAWLAAFKQVGKADLYASDGNHASYTGGFLTAAVLALSLEPKAELKPIQENGAPSEEVQVALINVAAETVKAHPPDLSGVDGDSEGDHPEA